MGQPDSPARAEEPVDVAALQARCGEIERQLAEARAEQAATADILRVIAASLSDLQGVLDAIAASAMRLCAADDAVIYREEAGDAVRAAHIGTIIAAPLGERIGISTLGRTVAMAHAFLDGRVV